MKIFGGDRKAARHLGAGDTARDRKEWSRASESYREYLALKPEDAAIWVQYGHALKESGFIDEAEKAYLRSLSISPNNADTYVQIGHIDKLKQRPAEAAAKYRKALELEPNLASAIEELRHLEPTTVATVAPSEKVPRPEHKPDDIAARLAQFEKQLSLLSTQLQAIRVLGGELLKLRNLSDQRHATQQESETRIATRLSEMDACVSALEARLVKLEVHAPALARPFSVLADHLSTMRNYDATLAAHGKELARVSSSLQALALTAEAEKEEDAGPRFAQ